MKRAIVIGLLVAVGVVVARTLQARRKVSFLDDKIHDLQDKFKPLDEVAAEQAAI